MSTAIMIEPVSNYPQAKRGDNIAEMLLEVLGLNGQELLDGDIVCIASKIVSISENRYIELSEVEVSPAANKLHSKIGRKDPRILQLILNQVDYNENKLKITGSWIGAQTKQGRMLTSGGIDKVDDETVLLLPNDPDRSARIIGESLLKLTGKKIAILITDSDGREDIEGATQLGIGLFGIPAIRKDNGNQETACDMLAAAAGLVMGQRGNNIPIVIIRGHQYEFSSDAALQTAISSSNLIH